MDVLSVSGESRWPRPGGAGRGVPWRLVLLAVLLKRGEDVERRTGFSAMGVRKGSVLLNWAIGNVAPLFSDCVHDVVPDDGPLSFPIAVSGGVTAAKPSLPSACPNSGL